MSVDQPCIITYYGSDIKCTIVKLKISSYANNDIVIMETDDQHIKEGFFISRIKIIPFIDKLRETKIWKLIK